MPWFVCDGGYYEEEETIEAMDREVQMRVEGWEEDAESNGRWNKHGLPNLKFGLVIGRGKIAEHTAEDGSTFGTGSQEDILTTQDIASMLDVIQHWIESKTSTLSYAEANQILKHADSVHYYADTAVAQAPDYPDEEDD